MIDDIKEADFDVDKGGQVEISVNKTWDYKYHSGFKKTKNTASVRTIVLDSVSLSRLQQFLKTNRPQTSNTAIFAPDGHAPVSAEINKILTQKLESLGLPRITFHGLRHTHASILLYQGVSILSVSKRLGHRNITTTQATYLHVIKELEMQDNEKILSILKAIQLAHFLAQKERSSTGIAFLITLMASIFLCQLVLWHD